MAAGSILKRVGKELLLPPKPPEEPEEVEEAAEVVADEPDWQLLHDEEGQSLGTAYRVPGVAVYVISDGYGTPQAELARCVAESGSQIMFQTERGRITALIYVPDPNRPPRRSEALRAEDV